MIESIKKNGKGIILMIISSIFACVGQLMWKIAAQSGFLFLVIGFFLYGIGAIVMIVAYKYGKVSVLQPVLSINYVFSILLARFVLNERMTLQKIIGVTIIIFGVLLVAGGDEVDTRV